MRTSLPVCWVTFKAGPAGPPPSPAGLQHVMRSCLPGRGLLRTGEPGGLLLMVSQSRTPGAGGAERQQPHRSMPRSAQAGPPLTVRRRGVRSPPRLQGDRGRSCPHCSTVCAALRQRLWFFSSPFANVLSTFAALGKLRFIHQQKRDHGGG